MFISDPSDGEEWKALDDGLAYGADMVRHIRKEFGDNFTICVAGIASTLNIPKAPFFRFLSSKNESL